MKKISVLLAMVFLIACSDSKKETWKPAGKVALEANVMEAGTSKKQGFVQQIEQAHQLKAVQQKEAIAFDIELYFGGKLRADATISMLSNSGKIKIAMKDGSNILFDGEKVYLSPETSTYSKQKARFDIFTWQYFFALPYKLSDPGTKWTMLEDKTLNGIQYNAGMLTFDNGIGDAPEDWYKVYKNAETNLLDIAAYIVTFSASKEEAGKEPHAIVYKDYTTVDGVPFATKWEFTGWDDEKGLTEVLGNAEIRNIKFLTAKEANFELPESRVEVGR